MKSYFEWNEMNKDDDYDDGDERRKKAKQKKKWNKQRIKILNCDDVWHTIIMMMSAVCSLSIYGMMIERDRRAVQNDTKKSPD